MTPNEVLKTLVVGGTCPEHPRYRKKRRPTGACQNWWFLWFLKALTEKELDINMGDS
jgi:hypothetical protein